MAAPVVLPRGLVVKVAMEASRTSISVLAVPESE
jgi:hypothetical protein